MANDSRTPISLLIDDCAPGIHVYEAHSRDMHGRAATKDGRPLLPSIPNSFLDDFADVAAQHGLAGKFSIVPNPGGRGSIPDRIRGVPAEEARQWLETVHSRLAPRFDFSPEMITHNMTLDLATGRFLELNEHEWSQTQDRATLTPYIAHALSLLKGAGVDATGVTSPWTFGSQVVAEYEAAIVAAQEQVYGRELSWYFCHMRALQPGAKPWTAVDDDRPRLVHIPSTTNDAFWRTIDSARRDDEWIRSVADVWLTADGRAGEVRQMLDNGGWPILLTHWQSLFSNGLRTGLRALDLVGRRICENLDREVRWCSCSELCAEILAEAGR